jgi:hypothetical protein
MAANTDLFKKLSRRWVGQIGSGGVADAVVTTVPLSSSTNLPTDTAVVATINRVDSNGAATPSSEETIIGVVSGSNLINCTRGVEGTAQAHDAGDVVEILVTAKGYNDLIDGFLVQHNQLGLHTNITASNITASGTNYGKFVTASTVTASDITATRNTSLCAVTASSINANVIYGGFITDTTTSSATTMNLGVGGSNRHTITLSDTTTSIYVSNATVGQAFLIRAVQDSAGSKLVSWFPGSTVRWPAATTPTLTTTANKADMFGFITIAASSYDGFTIGQNL